MGGAHLLTGAEFSAFACFSFEQGALAFARDAVREGVQLLRALVGLSSGVEAQEVLLHVGTRAHDALRQCFLCRRIAFGEQLARTPPCSIWTSTPAVFRACTVFRRKRNHHPFLLDTQEARRTFENARRCLALWLCLACSALPQKDVAWSQRLTLAEPLPPRVLSFVVVVAENDGGGRSRTWNGPKRHGQRSAESSGSSGPTQ